MWITSQEGPTLEIIHFEKIGLTTFVWVWVSFQTIHWSISCLATTTYLCWLCHIPLLDKEIYFVCLFTVAFPSGQGWTFSFTIPHGMHLVIPTHFSLFWVVRHPNRTFPPKEFKQEPQNRLPQTIPSLTSNTWPTTPILARYRLVVPKPCACSTFVCVQSLSAAHVFAMAQSHVCAFCYSFLTSCDMKGFLNLHSS